MSRKLVHASVLTALMMAAVSSASATMMVRPLTLEQVTASAARIVQAKVVAVDSGRDESGVPSTWVTLDVTRTLKGAAKSRVVIKQLGTAEPLDDGAITRIPGLPRYSAGEELVLFLHADSPRGFTSPVGLGQGVYRVTAAGSSRIVRNDVTRKPQALDRFLYGVARQGGSH